MNGRRVPMLLLQLVWLLVTLVVVLSLPGWPLRLGALLVSWVAFTVLFVAGLRAGWLVAPGAEKAQFRQPGDYRVVLQVRGPNPGPVVLVLRQTTGRSLTEAREAAGQAPLIVASGISQASADSVVARLTAAGARAVAAPMEDTP